MRIRHVKGSEEAVAASPLVIQKPEEFKGKWKKEVFNNENEIFLEVGMGMGTFIRTHAENEPGINYIGFEINTTVLFKALTRYEKERVEKEKSTAPEDCNLRFIRSDARHLEEYFAKGEVDKIYLNFSDPWPKDKNANKRLTSPVFLKLYDSILKKDGVIEFKTDNRGLFDYSVETIPAEGWEITQITYDLHNDESMNQGNIMTEYEAKFSAKGNPIYKLIARRK
ncbi:MAG: tRNA (guanosine(46)-N7)-methyltransferase TrmB [Eubacteriales bacterium]|nr:tRNA (guanosine(46)-N7)-methyltransferase TrmB [Eubacteriales bacterium]